MRALLVEDDSSIALLVRDALREAAYAVDWVSDGQAALGVLNHQHYDMVLLDLGLPGRGGLSVLDAIRTRGNDVPLLVITASDELSDRLRCRDGGADDGLAKPFQRTELLARMRAVTRRKAGSASMTLSNGVLALDAATHQASIDGQAPVQLSKREFSLLHALMLRPGTILSRSELEERIYGWGEEVESNAIEVHIHHLRRKLYPELIETIRGVGYLIRP